MSVGTPVLKSIIGIANVLCIDPGIVSKRRTDFDGVKYIGDDERSNISVHTLTQYATFSLLVCDASMDNYLIF